MVRSAPTPSGRLALSAGIVVVAVIAFGFWIRFAQGNGPVIFDQGWHDFLAANRNPVATAMALTLNTVGGTLWMTLITIATVLLFLALRQWRDGAALGVAVITSTLMSEFLKVVIARPRPAAATISVHGDSFPSGHSITAAVFAITLAFLLHRIWLWILAIVWIVAMAWSRTYLLVHWLSDTVSGALLGASIAVIAVWLVTTYWPRTQLEVQGDGLADEQIQAN